MNRFLVIAIAMTGLPSTGCISLLGPEDLRMRASLTSGVGIDREFAIGADGLTISLAASIAADLPVRGITWADVGVYRIRDSAEAGTVLRDVTVPGWQPLVRVRDGSSETLVLVKQGRSSVSGVTVFARDGDELIIARVKGFIGHLLEQLLQDERVPGLEDILPIDGVDEPDMSDEPENEPAVADAGA